MNGTAELSRSMEIGQDFPMSMLIQQRDAYG
jgi:hypothetical protein